jgi:GT2 family glycosyltransferase
MVRETFPEVRLMPNDVNRHHTYSNNKGLDQARGTYVLLLNNDTIVQPRAIDAMIDFLRSHPKAGAVGWQTAQRRWNDPTFGQGRSWPGGRGFRRAVVRDQTVPA